MKSGSSFTLEEKSGASLLRLSSSDGTNLLSADLVKALTKALEERSQRNRPLVIAGSDRFFSAGADLREILALGGPIACEFSRMGQTLMQTIARFPAPVYAAISGYCMGGGLDLALACGYRIASPNAVFGHRGAAFGLITGWGGTQRLPRLVGPGHALEMFTTAKTLPAPEALRIGLVDAIVDDPVAEALHRISRTS